MQPQTKPQWPKLPHTADKRKKVTQALKAKMVHLKRVERKSDRTIAGMLGLNHTTVRYHTNAEYQQAKNKKTVQRLKAKPVDREHRNEIQARNRIHHIEVLGLETVRTFQRENKRATQSKYKDYRTTCDNQQCKARYSNRIHNQCPKCKKTTSES
jgi:AraC-like DNA-binding protein